MAKVCKMALFGDLGKKLSSASQTAMQKGKEMADVVKLNSVISEEEKKINNMYMEIGRLYFEKCKDAPEEEFAECVAAIKEANSVIAETQQKIKDIKGVSQCPVCGADVPNGAAFCAKCGTKIEVVKPEEPTEDVEVEVTEAADTEADATEDTTTTEE